MGLSTRFLLSVGAFLALAVLDEAVLAVAVLAVAVLEEAALEGVRFRMPGSILLGSLEGLRVRKKLATRPMINRLTAATAAGWLDVAAPTILLRLRKLGRAELTTLDKSA
jgi:hypothetical protein